MPTLKMTVPHSLPREKAAGRVRAWLEKMVKEHEGSLEHSAVTWQDEAATFVFRADGVSISGSLTVESEAVDIEARLPLIALPFRSHIKGVIVGSLTRELAGR